MRAFGFAVIVCLLGCTLAGLEAGHCQDVDSVRAEPGAPPPLPPARKIPAITTEDPFPSGCIGCHVDMPDRNLDTRLSTLLKAWSEEVEPGLLAKAQATAPAGLTLKGKHPAAKSALQDIPAKCMKCHGADSKKAPPFARLIHRIHLTGGDENHFMTIFQGECTLCHKLDLETGAWSIPSAPEP